MDDKKEILKKARARFGRQSRSKRHEQKITMALYWTNAFHFSTPSIIDCLTQNRKRGFAKSLTDKGFLVERDIQSFLPYFPKKILVLSKQGREFLSFKIPDSDVWEGKIPESRIFHDYLVQIATLHKLKPILRDYQTFSITKEPQFTNKIYDSYIHYKTKDKEKRIGIEVDLTRKKTREVNNALFHIHIDIQNNLIDEVYFIFPKQHYELFKNQYEQVLHNKVFLYEKDQFNRYRKTLKSIQYSEEDREKIHFEAIDIPPQICPPPEQEKQGIPEDEIPEEILEHFKLLDKIKQEEA